MLWDRIDRETEWGRPIIVHDYEHDQAATHRGGAGVLTPVLQRLRMLFQYDTAELDAALLNAIFSAFIESPFDQDYVESALADSDKLNAFVIGTGLISGSDLYTAALISIFTDAAASPDDVIVDGTNDPRGWWGDSNIGSKLWLRTRSKATALIPALVKSDVETALQWMLDDDVVAQINVTTEWTKPNMLGGQIEFLRQDGARAALAFSRLWAAV